MNDSNTTAAIANSSIERIAHSIEHMRGLGYRIPSPKGTGAIPKNGLAVFGLANFIAMRVGENLAVRTVDSEDLSAVLKELSESQLARVMWHGGLQFQVHCWRRIKGRWNLSVEKVRPRKVGAQ